MEAFTPGASFAGGIVIGLAATALMALNGRIAGISGIAAGLLSWQNLAADWSWRAAFLLGLVLTPILLRGAGLKMPEIHFVASLPAMIVAGLLVGFGTVLGNGCTSGHGVCGIARLSGRSIVGTALFMVSALATVYLVRHLI